MNAAAGTFDRRIAIQVATDVTDAAGDVTQTWAESFKRWSIKADSRGREFFGAQQVVRDADTVFEVRSDSQTRLIAPETHRVFYNSRIYEIVAVAEGRERKDTLLLLCASRPDQRGARAPVA